MRTIFCVPKSLPASVEARASRRSVEVNPDNARRVVRQLPGTPRRRPPHRRRQAVEVAEERREPERPVSRRAER